MSFQFNPGDQLSEIRSMMERSSRFISLSGISGIIAGSAALLGVYAAVRYFGTLKSYYLRADLIYDNAGALTERFLIFLFVDALLVATVAIWAGIYFTSRRARKNGQVVWGPLTKRLLINLAIPIVAGGLFCLLLLANGALGLLLPASLVFYGLGLVSTSKYTLRDIGALGLTEIALGLLAGLFPAYSLLLWAVGFGLMHIIYGTVMWFKYERNH